MSPLASRTLTVSSMPSVLMQFLQIKDKYKKD